MSQKFKFNIVKGFFEQKIVLYSGLFVIFISIMFLTKDFDQAIVFVKNIYNLIINIGALIFLGAIISALMYIIQFINKLSR